MVRQYIYETRQSEHPHPPIRRYERRPQGPPSQPHYKVAAVVKLYFDTVQDPHPVTKKVIIQSNYASGFASQ